MGTTARELNGKMLKVFWHKEKVHWKRVGTIFRDNWSVAIIVSIFLTFFHYLFAIMHLLFESFLYVFNRERYRANLIKLSSVPLK